MKHFLEISQFSRQELEQLLDRAFYFKNQGDFPTYAHHTVANLFYENSTRTRISFELAARNLSMRVVTLDVHNSSENKGETIVDTVKTLAAMGIDCFVIRHKDNGIQQGLAAAVGDNIHLVNAGDGTHAHPSQALLDIMTIREHKVGLADLKIAIVGNIRHSRVANSLQVISKILGVGELVLIAPPLWQPQSLHYGYVTDNIVEGLSNADVIICLRVQKERLLADEFMDVNAYRADYAVSKSRLALAKKDAIVMHPGPINRGVEIDNEVANGPQSCILQQVQNGIYTRMAILEALFK